MTGPGSGGWGISLPVSSFQVSYFLILSRRLQVALHIFVSKCIPPQNMPNNKLDLHWVKSIVNHK